LAGRTDWGRIRSMTIDALVFDFDGLILGSPGMRPAN
jgi:hypothetical protein